jgi:PAS domain S-box-containing protein
MTFSQLRTPLALFGSRSKPRATDPRFQHLADQLPQLILLVSPHADSVLAANAHAVEFFGRSREEICTAPLSSLLTENATTLVRDLKGLAPGATLLLENSLWNGKAAKLTVVGLQATCIEIDDQLLVMLMSASAATVPAPAPARSPTPAQTLEPLLALQSALREGTASPAQNAAAYCCQLLGADALAIYDYIPNAGAPKLLAAQPLNIFPAYLPVDDAASSLTAWESTKGTPPPSVLFQFARTSGCTAIYGHPIPDATNSVGVLIAGFKVALPDGAGKELTSGAAKLASLFIAPEAAATPPTQESPVVQLLEDRLDLIFQEAVEAIIWVNPAGRVERLNAAAERLLGYAPVEVAGMDLQDILVASTPAASEVLHSLARGQNYRQEEVSVIRRDGTQASTALAGLPFFDSSSNADGGLVVLVDHSESKAVDARVHHLQQRAWLGDLSAVFAHEIRNPLNNIVTGLQLLKHKLDATAPAQGILDEMLPEAHRIAELVKNTLLIVQPSELHFEAVDLKQLLDRLAFRWGERLQRRKILCQVDVGAATPRALADLRCMEHVLTNLLANAMQALPESGGSITLTARTAPPKPERAGTHVEINVADTGPGIPPEVVARIFEPFYTTKASEGTGLGLAIAQRFVAAHKGTLTCQSFIGVGTAFTITLPAARAEPTAA